MASINIPAKRFKGLAKLLALPNEFIDSLVESLSRTEISANPEKVIAESVASSTGLEPSDVEHISEALLSLLVLQSNTFWSIEQFLDELVGGLRASGAEGLAIPDEQVESVKDRLRKLLSIEPLLLSAKALHIKFEHDNLFSGANVITQVLPVFGLSVEEQPKAAMLVHQLGVHYFQDGAHQTAYFLMDQDEIEDLIAVLERARRKSSSLKSFLEAANLQYIENV